MRVLVAGASGFVGSNLVPALVREGYDVRVLTRDRSRATANPDVEVVEADLLDRSTLDGVCQGVDVAYYLVHSLDAGGDFRELDRTAARNFLAAANAWDVDRIVYLGGLGEDGADLSEHLRSRREVEAILAEGRPALTVFRAAVIIGAGSQSFEMIRQLVTRLPVMITPEWVRTDVQPVAIRDVIEYLVGALERPETAGETLEIGGPEVLSYEDMMRRTARVLGRRLFVIPVPVLTPTLSAYWIDLVTDTPRHVTHPLIEGLKNPVVVTDDTARDLLGVEPTPFEAAVERAIGRSGDG